MAKIPANLLAEPEQAPKAPRQPDGSQTGAQALLSQTWLYDWGGKLRLDLVRLQCAVLGSMGAPLRADCPAAAVVPPDAAPKPRKRVLGIF